jgi:ubiquinone/menaquinone biosynthesis C-methylase UbiE
MTPAERAFDAMESRLTAAVSARMVELSQVRAGSRVLDLASGTGEPALRLARVVGPTGRVVGVELDAARVELARSGAPPWCEVRTGDVTEPLDEGPFDAATSRWGISYVRELGRVLAWVRRALVPGAPLVTALWAGPARVSWAALPRRVTERFVTLPSPPSIARFADVQDFTRELERTGFRAVHVEELEVCVVEDRAVERLVEWVEVVLSGLAERVPEAQRGAWRDALREELERVREGDTHRLGGTTRLVVAR